jgi:hypothetical protein
VEFEIVPEPTPAEREAILAALRDDATLPETSPYASRWRREAIAGDEDE